MTDQIWGERKLRAFRDYIAFNGIVVYPVLTQLNIGNYYAKSIEWEPVKEAVAVSAPDCVTFRLEPTAAQVLMDDLWQCGVRPTEGHYTTGQVNAQDKHIQHLHEVTTRLLGIVEKKG